MCNLSSMRSPTLYIGEHRHGLYALPSLVDSSTATISSNAGHMMLEGPLTIPDVYKNENTIPVPGDHVTVARVETIEDDYQSILDDKKFVMLGKINVAILGVCLTINLANCIIFMKLNSAESSYSRKSWDRMLIRIVKLPQIFFWTVRLLILWVGSWMQICLRFFPLIAFLPFW